MTHSNSGNPTHETFNTTHVLISLDASFMAGDFEIGNFPLTLPLSIIEEDALRQELAGCRSFADLGGLFVALRGAADTAASRPAAVLSPEENVTADRLLRDALAGMAEDSNEDPDSTP